MMKNDEKKLIIRKIIENLRKLGLVSAAQREGEGK